MISLRSQLYGSILLALLAGLLCGSTIACMQARQSVRHEMERALGTAANIAQNAPQVGRAPRTDFVRFVHGFDGDRHLRVQLWLGGALLSSKPAPRESVPDWYVRLLDVPAQRRFLSPGEGVTLAITTDPHNEISESWAQLQDSLMVLLGSSALMLLLSGWGFHRAARPFKDLVAALRALGTGNYDVALTPHGPSELQALARGFNAMAAKLNAFEMATRRLHGQLLSIEEEERVQIARDLHDDMGPLLFAAKLGVQKLRADLPVKSVAHGRTAELQELIDNMYAQMRDILSRLRSDGAPQDLTVTLENLVGFWRAQNPAISIHLDTSRIHRPLPTDLTQETYHIIQEALTNAVRHSGASDLWITVSTEEIGMVLEVQDNGIGIAFPRPESISYGMRGMRERVAAMGGTIMIASRRPCGTSVSAQIPYESFLS